MLGGRLAPFTFGKVEIYKRYKCALYVLFRSSHFGGPMKDANIIELLYHS